MFTAHNPGIATANDLPHGTFFTFLILSTSQLTHVEKDRRHSHIMTRCTYYRLTPKFCSNRYKYAKGTRSTVKDLIKKVLS
jgi:hypothetical protein